MESKSILDQIISNLSAEEVAKLNAPEILNNLFSELNERERDILTRRFGLRGKEKETLENIGGAHKLTRERIRQIEIAAIKKLRDLENLENYISGLKKIIIQLLEEHGGFAERNYLLDILVNFSADGNRASEEEKNVHKSYLDFLISKLLREEFEEIGDSEIFKNSVKFKHQTLEHLEKLARELVGKIQEAKKVFTTAELISLARESESFKNNKDKFDTSNNIDISGHLGNITPEEAEIININKALYSILRAHKHVEQNKFGQWGLRDWREISPKTINDKIYLVLKKEGRPMHFVEIAEKINATGFDDKRANAATVHNELILDEKYILVGRGLYGLKEWGYKSGTVADIIAEILESAPASMGKDEITEKVMDQRMVKKATIVLALMNKEKFEKTADGKYRFKN